MRLVSVVLSGGGGSRLWPVSRHTLPKPFMKLGGTSLLQQAVARAQACGTDDVLIVTNQDHLFITQDEIGRLNDPPHVRYLLEPKGRNTAPAIALAALACARQYGEEAVMLILPADHLIPDTGSFVANTLEAARHAQRGQLVVFGILPTAPETGFGYIEVEKLSRDPQAALCFVEKPNAETAGRYLATGRFYWNSGMFCFTVKTVLAALDLHAPEVLDAARTTWGKRTEEGDVNRFDAHAFGLQPDISLDYAVMERAANVTLIPAKFGWSDVGSWPAVAQTQPADAAGNTFLADVVAIDTSGTHVQIESHGRKIVATIGIEDLVIVDTPDALLVAHKSKAQQVKALVEKLKARGHASVLLPAVVDRPWGTYVSLKEEDGYKVKRITVKPGASLSLQYHHHRAEHWVVVSGTGLVQIGESEYVTGPGQYRYIPVNEKHRLSNTGETELVLIEVECGDYLGEDDIVRLADIYGRV